MKPNQKLSLVYTVGSYIAACGPATVKSIMGEIRRQYIGSEIVTDKQVCSIIGDLIMERMVDVYDETTNDQPGSYTIGKGLLEYIEKEENKYEDR